MKKENCALKLVDEIILYYDARSKKHQIMTSCVYIIYDLFFDIFGTIKQRDKKEDIKE